MAKTLSDLVQRVLELNGVHSDGEAIEELDKKRVEEFYTTLYAELKDENLAEPTATAFDDAVLNPIANILAFELDAVYQFGFPVERRNLAMKSLRRFYAVDLPTDPVTANYY